ncbi:hypothetical protein [Leifsonia sp. Le1]|uniref:hypothetical protein n=1 Tax=Leifsonia sp. Le1 TaxID=3404918 RepID=UPI003EB70046
MIHWTIIVSGLGAVVILVLFFVGSRRRAAAARGSHGTKGERSRVDRDPMDKEITPRAR